jgi:phage gp29-like protein
VSTTVDFSEIGRSGLRQWGGYVYEEFLPELYGIRAVQKYKEMSENDAVVGAMLFAIEMLLRKVDWRVEPYSSAREDQEAADFLTSCMDDMSHTWADTISEVLTMLIYGWAYHEIVYKRRQGPSRDPTKNSKYNDGRIGWRKLPLRAQNTLLRWEFDDTGGIQGMWQNSPPDYQLRFIPIEKALLFRTRTNKGNPEGRSVLRNAYRAWYFKKQIEVIEGIGVERDLAGLPVLTPPEGLDIWNPDDPEMVKLLRQAESTVRNIRRDEMEGVVKPAGWTLELLNSGGRRQLDVNAIIQRYDQRIAMSVLADFILLGSEQVGSYALAVSKSDIFMQALHAWLDMIAEVFNRYAIPRLFALNPGLPQENLPTLQHGEVDAPNLQELGQFIKDLTGVGVLTPGPELEGYLRQVANLPELPEAGS